MHKRIAMKVCRPLISLPNFLFVAMSSVYWQAAGGQCPLWVKSRHVQRTSVTSAKFQKRIFRGERLPRKTSIG